MDKELFNGLITALSEVAEKEHNEYARRKILQSLKEFNSGKTTSFSIKDIKGSENQNNQKTIKIPNTIKMAEAIEKHDTLNQALFDGDELKEDVKEAIEKIVNQFVSDLKEDGIKIEVEDIILVGSNVSYNYTKDSDLDVHILVNEDTLDCNPELYSLLYGAYRTIFNKNYDITIKGVPVELYVELI